MRQPPPPLFLSAFIALQFLVHQPNGVAAQVQYPAAQACFNAATTSAKCDDSSTAKFNPCACSNTGNWLGLSAACIGTADNSQLNAIYQSLQSNCGTNNPIAFSLQQWLAAAGSSGSTPGPTTPITTAANSPPPSIVSTTVTTTAPTTATAVVTLTKSGSVIVVTPSNAQTTGSLTASSSSKLKTGAIVGIAIGAVCLIALAGLAFICMRKRGQADRDSRITSMTFNPHDSGHYASIPVAAERPQPDATGFSEPALQSYQQGSYSSQPLGSQPASDIPQAYSPHELPVSQPATYGEGQHYSTRPPPGRLELQGQPITGTHEMRRYGYVG
jgi:hypothetical protein